MNESDLNEEGFNLGESLDDFDDDHLYPMPEYLDECNDAFDIIDSILASDVLIDEDEKTVMQMDLEIAESNQVTEDQYKTLDALKEKYKVNENEA